MDVLVWIYYIRPENPSDDDCSMRDLEGTSSTKAIKCW